MKYLAIIGMLCLSKCCNNSSGLKLDEEGLKWILPYENHSYFIFKDDEGNIDSLKVDRISEIDNCGGHECVSDCEVEIANVYSIINPKIKFNIEVNSSQQVYINEDYSRDNYINLYIFTVQDRNIFSVSEKFSLIHRTDYFRIDCKNNSNCFGYPMKGMVFTKQEGLIEYTTADNKKWTKVN